MDLLAYIVKGTLIAFLSIIDIAMLARALMSWFADPDGVLFSIVYFITEPLIMPMRLLCEKFGWFQEIPIDIPFIITILLISMLETLVSLI